MLHERDKAGTFQRDPPWTRFRSSLGGGFLFVLVVVRRRHRPETFRQSFCVSRLGHDQPERAGCVENMVRKRGADLRHLFRDLVEPFLLLTFERDPGEFDAQNLAVDNAALSFIQRVPFIAVFELLERLVDGLALAEPQTKCDHIVENRFVCFAEFVRVQNAEQVTYWTPAVVERDVHGFDWFNESGPCWLYRFFKLFQLRNRVFQDRFDGGNDVFGLNLVKCGETGSPEKRVI